MSMTPEERAVIRLALRWDAGTGGPNAEARLRHAIQALRVSRQPLHTVEPIPCMVYANNSATMFCILPKGHKGSEPEMHGPYEGPSRHVGLAANRPGLEPARRVFNHWRFKDTMERHERPACARFPGCTRHPKREAKS